MHWKNTTGNTLNGHTLSKSDKQWTLYTATGLTYPLGPRASFDHAETLIASDAIVASVVNAWLFARAYDARVTLQASATFVYAGLAEPARARAGGSPLALRCAAYFQLSTTLKQDANDRAESAKDK